MTPPVVWMSEAHAELNEARNWYESIRPDLGERFSFAADATINAIVENPLRFPAIFHGLRRAGVRRFPYGIFFEVQESRILVVACFHGSRDPKHWQAR